MAKSLIEKFTAEGLAAYDHHMSTGAPELVESMKLVGRDAYAQAYAITRASAPRKRRIVCGGTPYDAL